MAGWHQNSIPPPRLNRLVPLQVGVLLTLCGILWFVSPERTFSLLLGGLIHIAAQAYFTRLAFRYRGASQAREMMRAIYRGEAGKLLLAATGFALVFVLYPAVDAVALFSGYIVMLLVHLFATAQLVNKKN